MWHFLQAFGAGVLFFFVYPNQYTKYVHTLVKEHEPRRLPSLFSTVSLNVWQVAVCRACKFVGEFWTKTDRIWGGAVCYSVCKGANGNSQEHCKQGRASRSGYPRRAVQWPVESEGELYSHLFPFMCHMLVAICNIDAKIQQINQSALFLVDVCGNSYGQARCFRSNELGIGFHFWAGCQVGIQSEAATCKCASLHYTIDFHSQTNCLRAFLHIISMDVLHTINHNSSCNRVPWRYTQHMVLGWPQVPLSGRPKCWFQAISSKEECTVNVVQ